MWHRSVFAPPDDALLNRTLASALADIAKKWPDAPAVIDRNAVITFAELTCRAGGLAAQLSALRAEPGPVALLQKIGVDVVAAWFACALAGRPFVLLEPNNPPERNRALVAQAGVRIVVSDEALDGSFLTGIADVAVLHPDGRFADMAAVMAPDGELACDAPAMIFPTSGSTGEPKLITYSARTLQAKVQASIPLMGVHRGDRVLIAGSHSNYGFLHHALVFLLSGGALCLADLAEGGLSAAFDAILRHKVRHVRFTPSLFRVAAAQPAGLAALRTLDAVRFSGEPLLAADLQLARSILSKNCRIQNVYGSTESGLFIWTDEVARLVASGTVPIGQIYPLWEFSIVGDDGAPVRAGELGELTISSPHQALGDWQEGTPDRSRFPDDPRGGQRRLYSTGDIVRLGRNGQLVLLGRKDRLVKINGMRVSLDEIEANLREMPGCAQAVVLEVGTIRGNRLAAFLVGDGGAHGAGEVAAWLAVRLPQHMIPAPIQWLSTIPLLPGGKVDRKALLASLPGDDASIAAGTEDPRSALAAIWRQLLKLPGFDEDSDFFGLGGDSLLMMELQLEVERRFNRSFSRDRFLAQPTLRGLAAILGLDPAEAPDRHEPDAPMRFRLVRHATAIRQGNVICMPGFGGAATAELLAESALFADFDLWACDVRFGEGSIVDGRRWLAAAVAAAEQLDQGNAPRPDILVGYSVGGYIAWLVAKLLGGSKNRPLRVVTIDTTPMHRIRRHRSAQLNRILKRVATAEIELLDIRRHMPPPFRPAGGTQSVWQPEDGRVATILVETLEHLDMIKVQVLDRVAEVINSYCAGHQIDDGHKAIFKDIDTSSGNVAKILAFTNSHDYENIHEVIAKNGDIRGLATLSALLFLSLAHSPFSAAKNFVARFCELHPTCAAGHYAKARLRALSQTEPSQLQPDWASTLMQQGIQLPSCSAVDHALRLRSGEKTASRKYLKLALAFARSLSWRFRQAIRWV